MRIFLTGATGFVGHHVAHALAAQGAQLRMLVRKTSNLAHLEGIPGDTCVGDLAQPESLRSGFVGCDAVVHVAADYRLWIPDPESMYRANVEGACLRRGCVSRAAVRRSDSCCTPSSVRLFQWPQETDPVWPRVSRPPAAPRLSTRRRSCRRKTLQGQRASSPHDTHGSRGSRNAAPHPDAAISYRHNDAHGEHDSVSQPARGFR